MTENKKGTKRALLVSAIVVVLCLALLMGSTFAWFTDSATTGVNTITAGNLDVELEYKPYDETTNAYGDWTTIPTTSLFKEALWEPGYTQVVYLRVRNNGTLALKYEFSIKEADKTIGKTADDKDIDLAKYIEFGVVEVDNVFDTRADARKAVETGAHTVESGYTSGEGHLTAKDTDNATSKMLALVVYMPETIGNEANHGPDDNDVPSIDLGIELVATQDTVESDSFDNEYDKDAKYPKNVANVDELKDAVANAQDGDVIALETDMTLTEELKVNKDIVIDGNGQKISGKPIKATADVTLKNVVMEKPTNTSNNASALYAGTGCESLVLDGVTFSNPQWEAIQVTSNELKTLTITNCTFDANSVQAVANSGYGTDGTQLVRFIHFQPSAAAEPVVNITITNNTFNDCNKLGTEAAVAGIYYYGPGSSITLGGNTFKDWAEGDVVDGKIVKKMAINWPRDVRFMDLSVWEGAVQTYSLDLPTA